jgi:YVTN family beta-propeller protein
VADKAYVANQNSNNVTVIDGGTLGTSTLGVGASPSAIAMDPATGHVYVANLADDNVTLIGRDSYGTATVTVGTGPRAVDVNPLTHKIYVANGDTNDVTVIDGATRTTTTVAAGTRPVSVAVNPATNKIYVANNGSSNITIIDGATNATTSRLAGASPQFVAVNPATNKIYVANAGSNTVTVLDGATNTGTTVTVGTNPVAIGVNPVTNKIYVANRGDATITVIDGATNATSSVAALLGPVAVAVNPVTDKIYVADEGGVVVAIDGATNAASQIGVGSIPSAVAVNPATNTVYVVDRGSNDLEVIDGATNAVTAAIPVGTAPFTVAVNPVTNTVYVGHTTSGNVTVIDGATLATATVSTGGSPRSIAIDPVTNKAYTANFTSDSVTELDPTPLTLAAHGTTVTMPGGNVTSNPSPSLSFSVSGAYAPTDPAVLGVEYRLSDAQSFSEASGSGPFTATIAGARLGLNYVAAFAADAMEGTQGGSTGTVSTSMIGAPSVFPFVMVPPPAITTASPLPAGLFGIAYSQVLAATGGVGAPYTFAVSGGALPAGLTLSSAGTLSGTPAQAGIFSFTVTVTDASGGTGSTPFSLTITAGLPGAPVIGTATAGDSQATVSFTAPASDGGSAITSYTAISSPGGVTGTCSAPCTSILVTGLTNGTAYTFTVTATNGVGTGAPSAASNSVTPAALGPFVPGTPTIGPAIGGDAQATVDFIAPASDGGSPITMYTATSSPGGITGTCAAPCASITILGLTNGVAYTFTVTATNAVGTSAPSTPSNPVTPAGPATVTTFSGPSATGTGTITASFTGSAGCTFVPTPRFIPVTGDPASPPVAPPSGVVFPQGLFDFQVNGCVAGSSITMTMIYPTALPAGTRYWKFGPTSTNPAPHWYILPATIAGNTATFTIVDGGLGDDDLAANGTIVDQGGPGFGGGGAQQVPTLSQWALLLLASLMLTATMARERGKRSRGRR